MSVEVEKIVTKHVYDDDDDDECWTVQECKTLSLFRSFYVGFLIQSSEKSYKVSVSVACGTVGSETGSFHSRSAEVSVTQRK